MTDTVTIRRELLERCAQYTQTLEKQEDRGRALAELRAALAAPVQGDAALNEWAKDRFTISGRYKGDVYGNTDWAIARAIHSDLFAHYTTTPQPADVGELVEALRYFVSRESAIQAKFDLHGPADIAAGMRIKLGQAEAAIAAARKGEGE